MAHNQTIPQIIPPSITSLTKPSLSLSPFFSTTPPSLFLSASIHVRNTTMSVFAANQSIVGNTTSTTVGALILGLVFLLGVPGNLFIIWSILARARRRSVTTLLILNLAVADGSLIALTPFFIVYLVKKTWIFGDIMCKILFYLCLANMYASIQLIMLMSLHRLVAVVWPRRVAALAGRKAVLRWVLVLWILVLVASIPALLFRHQLTATYPNRRSRMVCESFHKQQSQVVLQYTLETVLGFVVPYGLIVGSYICILRRIRQTRFRRRIHSEKLILTIVVTFGIFWLPYHVINIVQVAAALSPQDSAIKARLDLIWQSCRAVTSALAFISSCANPVLYTFAGKSYIRREGFAFMARLFEGTALDSGTRKNRQNSQNSRERDRDVEGFGLKEKEGELESTTSANVVSPICVKPVKNGK
ncbi:leukotriene B4 receptor 1 [Salmo salar]|uniref:Leukotriene B4 receptor 1 n=1 Tax=Salmo salar TaxID=8030 RepID=A0A1S3N9C6_SALSA|nr:leukotriene B4 receptor 1-like [Salmo salar]|eukprot:XP_014012017.1 PREDICTED: leukotriene B4 receptor 1-like [Salmo salar]